MKAAIMSHFIRSFIFALVDAITKYEATIAEMKSKNQADTKMWTELHNKQRSTILEM